MDETETTNSWEQAWLAGRTGWDAGAAAPALLALLEDESSGRDGRRALVPGCGSGYDVFALADAGLEALGVDIAPSARARFESLRAGRAGAEIRIGDMFAPELLADLEGFDLIWDYTFLCALEPSMRESWAERVLALLKPQAQLWTLIFPVPPGLDPDTIPEPISGPPYPVSPALLKQLLEPRGLVLEHLEQPALSHPGRAGMEYIARWSRP